MGKDLLYHHNGQIIRMSQEAVSKVLSELEVKSRTGKFTYTEQQVFQAQVKEMQAIWPAEVAAVLRQAAKDMTPQGQSVSPATIRQAMLITYEKAICPKRAELSGNRPDNEYRDACGDIALSTLFNRAPSGALQPLQSVRKYADNGKLIKVKLSSAPQRLVVNCDELEKSDGTEKTGTAEIYVQAYYNMALKVAMLIGFATRGDVRAATRGNKFTDSANCAWDKMAFYMPIKALRPMSDFLSEAGITEVPQGFVFEKVPSPQDFPVMAKQELQDIGKGESPETFDFLASCGIAPAKKPAQDTASPAQNSSPKEEKGLDI